MGFSASIKPSDATIDSQTSFGGWYDWTTGVPHDGNEWKKYRVVPRAHPSRTLPYAYFNRSGSKGAFSFPGATSPTLPLYGGTFARSYLVSTVLNSKVTNFTPGLSFQETMRPQEPSKIPKKKNLSLSGNYFRNNFVSEGAEGAFIVRETRESL